MSLKLPKCHIWPKLRPVDVNDDGDIAMLWGVLKRRLDEPETNVSHTKMPEWDDHVAYVRRKPHGRNNFIITSGGWAAGHCYLSQRNEVGVFIYPDFRRDGFGQWAVRQMIEIAEKRGGNTLANINPANATAIRLFQKLGFKERTRSRKQVVLEKRAGKPHPDHPATPVPSGNEHEIND